MINQYLNTSKFWNTKDKQEQYKVIGIASEALRVISILLYPIIPSYSALLLKYFKVDNITLDKCKIELDKDIEIRYDSSVKDKLFIRRLQADNPS